MNQNEKRPPPKLISMMFRFKTEEQRELIREAAKSQDQSMNAFIRSAAEKAARRVLGKGGNA